MRYPRRLRRVFKLLPLESLDDLAIDYHDIAIGGDRTEETREIGPGLSLLEMLVEIYDSSLEVRRAEA